MPITSLSQVVTPTSPDPTVNLLLNVGQFPSGTANSADITYNYVLPSQNYINFSFDPSQYTGSTPLWIH